MFLLLRITNVRFVSLVLFCISSIRHTFNGSYFSLICLSLTANGKYGHRNPNVAQIIKQITHLYTHNESLTFHERNKLETRRDPLMKKQKQIISPNRNECHRFFCADFPLFLANVRAVQGAELSCDKKSWPFYAYILRVFWHNRNVFARCCRWNVLLLSRYINEYIVAMLVIHFRYVRFDIDGVYMLSIISVFPSKFIAFIPAIHLWLLSVDIRHLQCTMHMLVLLLSFSYRKYRT